jgi:hypothetical protein
MWLGWSGCRRPPPNRRIYRALGVRIGEARGGCRTAERLAAEMGFERHDYGRAVDFREQDILNVGKSVDIELAV